MPEFSLFNRPIPVVIEELSEVPISSNQNVQENEQSEDDEGEEIGAIPEDDVSDVIDFGDQVEEFTNEGISTSQWVETDVREEPARPAFHVDRQYIAWKVYSWYDLV